MQLEIDTVPRFIPDFSDGYFFIDFFSFKSLISKYIYICHCHVLNTGVAVLIKSVSKLNVYNIIQV